MESLSIRRCQAEPLPQLTTNPTMKNQRRYYKRSAQRKPKDPTQGLDIVHAHAGAVDIGSRSHWAAIGPQKSQEPVREFGCCTDDLEQMAQWFKSHAITSVVMEATGNYWVALAETLEKHGIEVCVVNASYAQHMQGRKGDISDAQWMQKLHTYGLFAKSFRPQEPIRELRAYTRLRDNAVRAASESIQHMQKALTEMNVQLANVISDISGETGLRIIDAIIGGERDPAKLAGLKDRRIKASQDEIARALKGTWKTEQLFALEQARLSFTHFYEQSLQCQDKIEEQLSRLAGKVTEPTTATAEQSSAQPLSIKQQLKRIIGVDLTAIDGIGELSAQVFLSEVGSNVDAWPSEKHFSSWLGLCPNHRISGGKILKRSTRPVYNRVRHILRIAAYTLERSKSWLGAKYRRLKSRLGAPKAITAMASHLAKLIYRMIKFGQEYVDRGAEQYQEKFRQQTRRWLEKKAKELNLQLVAIQ